jgi:hypothetical protein
LPYFGILTIIWVIDYDQNVQRMQACSCRFERI